MAHYTYTPTHWNGNALTGGNLDCRFRARNGPGRTRPFKPVEAEVVGLGQRAVRAQPRGVYWDLHVILTDVDDSDLDSFHKIFDEEAGLVVLKATDGAGSPATWRISARVVEIIRQPRSDHYFIVRIRVPDPTWQNDTETSATQSAMSGDQETWTMTNNGDRKARPTFTVKPQSVRTTVVEDYVRSIRGFVVNRAPKLWNNYPVHFFDDAGASDTLDHAAMVTGSERCDINDAAGISNSQTTIPYDGGRNGNLGSAGLAMIENEQIYYTGGGAAASGTLTGVVRGVGGTSAAAHADNTAIEYSQVLANGDDIRLWVNDVEVSRWIDGANTATLKLWANVTMPPALTLTLRADITAGSPADAGELEFVEGVENLPERGQVAIENEVITYQGRDVLNRKITTIERGAWGTTAASHTTAVTAYRCDVLFVISSGMAKATGPPDAINTRPCLQLASSTNIQWLYGDTGDDPNAVFYDYAYPARTAAWVPSYYVPPADNNNAQPLNFNGSSGNLGWRDRDPIDSAGKPYVGRVRLALPQGLESGPAKMIYDVQPRKTMRLRVLGEDIRGNEIELLDDYDFSESSAASQTIGPNAEMYALTINAVRALAAGNMTEDQDLDISALASVWQKVVLEEDCEVDRVFLKLKRSVTNNFTWGLEIWDNSGSDPASGRMIQSFDTTSAGDFLSSSLTTSAVYYDVSSSSGTTWLEAGTYWLRVRMVDYTSGTLTVRGAPTATKDNSWWDGTNWHGVAALFGLIHKGGGPVRADIVRTNANLLATMDNIILNLNDADSYTPYVDRDGDFSTNLHHCSGEIKNTTTGDTIDIDTWLSTSGELEINCENRTVKITEGNHVRSAPTVITPSDLEDWCPLDPGANSMEFNEQDMVDTDLDHAFRDTKV